MVSNAGGRRTQILDAVIPLVGHFGFKKTSVKDLATAAGLTKQGLYLHFDSKEELLEAAMRRYFEEGLRITREALERPGIRFQQRLIDALDSWFGRHLAHFNPASLEVVEPSGPAKAELARIKRTYCKLLESAIATAPEYALRGHVCKPAELACVLFQFGLTWKEGHSSRTAFRETLRLCVYACFPPGDGRKRDRGAAR